MPATRARVTRVLRTEADYDAAVEELNRLLEGNPRKGTTAFDRLELLSVLIEAFDDEHYRMGDKSTPQDVVEFMLQQKGMSHGDLADMLGGRSRVSEFFRRKRRLSIEQIKTLRDKLDISADLLID